MIRIAFAMIAWASLAMAGAAALGFENIDDDGSGTEFVSVVSPALEPLVASHLPEGCP